MILGVKAELAKRIKDFHIQFLIYFSRKMAPSDMEFIDSILQQDVTIPAIADKIVATIVIGNSEIHVPCHVLHELRLARPLSVDLLSIIWKMFEKRDSRISNAYREINHGKASYVAYRESFFASVGFMDALSANPESNTLVTDFFPAR